MIIRNRYFRVYAGVICSLTLVQFLVFVFTSTFKNEYDGLTQIDPNIKLTKFDPNKDWLVLFHMQKTSCTNFDLELLSKLTTKRGNSSWTKVCRVQKPLRIQSRRQKLVTKYECPRDVVVANSSWYLSWHTSFGWQCGLHPDYGDLKACVEKKLTAEQITHGNVHYITMLREPVLRYFSEWRHVSRTGSAWVFDSESLTNGQKCAKKFFKKCLRPKQTKWLGVSLDDFDACKWNLASNRQTRMLAVYGGANLSSVCDWLMNGGEKSSFGDELLDRAKRGLHSLTFFGLASHYTSSLQLFEKTFNGVLRFDYDLNAWNKKKNLTRLSMSENFLKTLDVRFRTRIEHLNRLDIELYKYAEELFFQRLDFFHINR